jgi:hypothetical protein
MIGRLWRKEREIIPKELELKDYVVLERKKSDGSIYYTAYTERPRLLAIHAEDMERHMVCVRTYPPYPFGTESLDAHAGKRLILCNIEYIQPSENVSVKEFEDPCKAKETVCRLVREEREREANKNHCRVVSEGKCCDGC